jgi:hypothetical protein
MRKWKLRRALAGLALVAAVATLVFWQGRDRVTAENYERIHKGMTRSEVEAILGPPGDYASGPAVGEDELWWRLRFQLADHSWVGNSAWIMVTYEKDLLGPELVNGFSFQPIERADVGLVGNLVWRTQRGWRRVQRVFEQKVRE